MKFSTSAIKKLMIVLTAGLTVTGFSQTALTRPFHAQQLPPEDCLPVEHTITDTSGRKMEATILAKTAITVKIRRASDGKEFDLSIQKLSPDDQKFLGDLGKPIPIQQTEFEITLKGTPVKITRLGNGPIGVIFFGNSDSAAMKKYILSDAKAYNNLLQWKTTFFLWEYPKTGPFAEVESAITDYLDHDTKKTRPNFQGIATEALKNIREKTKLRKFLLAGNSLGAGIILWDYKTIATDPNTSFLLISPTEAFMPPVSSLPKLERTMLLSATGWKNAVSNNPEDQARTDQFLQGIEASDWVLANMDIDAVEKISAAVRDQFHKLRLTKKHAGSAQPCKAGDFRMGHKIIGDHITNETLCKILRVDLGMAPKDILAKRPQPFSAKDPNDIGLRTSAEQNIITLQFDKTGVALIKIPNGATALVEFTATTLPPPKTGPATGTYRWKYRPGPGEPIQTGEGKLTNSQDPYTKMEDAGYDSYIQAGGIFIEWFPTNELRYIDVKGTVTKLPAGSFDQADF